jgi:hypothetical protein
LFHAAALGFCLPLNIAFKHCCLQSLLPINDRRCFAGRAPLSRKATPVAPHHRAVHSHGGDIRLGGTSSAALQASLAAAPPFIRPEHRVAALLPASGAASSSIGGAVPGSNSAANEASGSNSVAGGRAGKAGVEDVVQLLAADGPSGPSAAWLLAEGLQQHVALPLVDAESPVVLWWRVMAGTKQCT